MIRVPLTQALPWLAGQAARTPTYAGASVSAVPGGYPFRVFSGYAMLRRDECVFRGSEGRGWRLGRDASDEIRDTRPGLCGRGVIEKAPLLGAGPVGSYVATVSLGGSDVGCAGAFLALAYRELDRLAFVEGGVSLGLDLRVMDEEVLAAIGRTDKTESLV
jgi:hypothetical protein